MKILDCKGLRDKIEADVKAQISRLVKEHNVKPSLCVIMVGDNPASESYVKSKRKACERVGIDFVLQKFEKDVPQRYIKDFIREANYKYDGVMVQLPLPVGYDTEKILSCIAPTVDVDGLTQKNKERLYTGRRAFVPCTALGVIMLLEENKDKLGSLNGKNICIVGRSDLVGRPLAYSLEKTFNATVTLCHSHTDDKKNNLERIIGASDIVIMAVGNPKVLDVYKANNRVEAYIDCGYNFVDGKACGDVDLEMLETIGYNGYVTTTPKGTGLLTVSGLLLNVLNSCCDKYNI